MLAPGGAVRRRGAGGRLGEGRGGLAAGRDAEGWRGRAFVCFVGGARAAREKLEMAAPSGRSQSSLHRKGLMAADRRSR